VQALQQFASRGSAELRWKDEQGDHFEQAQIELAWRDGGERMALRADKLGERIAWAGADSTQWWIFEPKSEPSRLIIGARGMVPSGSALPFAGPESVMELLAARAWPENAQCVQGQSQESETQTQTKNSCCVQWSLAKPIGAWTSSRAWVQQPGALPVRIELLNVQGGVIASSELSRPLSVQVDGVPQGAWPDIAGTTQLRMSEGGGRWNIFWDAPGTNAERLKDRLFDLAVLREVMRPQQVRDLRDVGENSVP